MIGKICAYLHNYFTKDLETLSVAFSGNTITGDFQNTYFAGQYLHVTNSYINDGVYLITDVASDTLTVSDTMNTESTDEIVCIESMSPPKEFLELVTEISAFTAKDGVQSESIDDYSVSFAKDGSWQSVYANKLSPYKRLGW